VERSSGSCQAIRLESNRSSFAIGLQPAEEAHGRRHTRTGEAKKADSPGAGIFVELIGPAGAGTDCHIEVESERGVKVRLELKGIATAELAGLIRGFLGQ
jgi:hypothetical protein